MVKHAGSKVNKKRWTSTSWEESSLYLFPLECPTVELDYTLSMGHQRGTIPARLDIKNIKLGRTLISNLNLFTLIDNELRSTVNFFSLTIILLSNIAWCVQFRSSPLWDLHPETTGSWQAWRASCHGEKSNTTSSHPEMSETSSWREAQHGRHHRWTGTITFFSTKCLSNETLIWSTSSFFCKVHTTYKL